MARRRVFPILGAALLLTLSLPALAKGGGGGRAGGGGRVGVGGQGPAGPLGRVQRGGGQGRNPSGGAPRAEGRAGRDKGPGRNDGGKTQPGRAGGRENRSQTKRHRDRSKDRRPDRQRRWRNRVWWPYYFGYGASPLAFRSPFYDPFYSGFYYSGGSSSEGAELGKNVIVKVKPDNAQIYVNGLLYSNKGRTSFDLPMGQWVVEIRAPGYLPETVTLNVQQGVRYEIERKLQKDPITDGRGRPLKVEELSPR